MRVSEGKKELTNPENLHGVERILEAQSGAEQHQTQCSHTRAELEGNKVLDVIKDALALFDRAKDSRKVIIRQNHVGSLLGNISAQPTHRNANVSLFQSRRIINTVTGHGNNIPARLQRPHNLHLMVWASAGEDRRGGDCLSKLGGAHVVKFITTKDRSGARGLADRHPELLRNGDSRGLGITGDHHDPDSTSHQTSNRLVNIPARRIVHAHQSRKDQSIVTIIIADWAAVLGGRRA